MSEFLSNLTPNCTLWGLTNHADTPKGNRMLLEAFPTNVVTLHHHTGGLSPPTTHGDICSAVTLGVTPGNKGTVPPANEPLCDWPWSQKDSRGSFGALVWV